VVEEAVKEEDAARVPVAVEAAAVVLVEEDVEEDSYDDKIAEVVVEVYSVVVFRKGVVVLLLVDLISLGYENNNRV
jgi:hypothetical protein